MNNIAIQLITMFGIGRISKIPGTIASFVTCLFYFLCMIFNINIIFLLISFFIILILSTIFINKYSSNFTEIDAKEIVIDEFLGQSIPIYLYEISHGTEKSADEAIIFYCICFVLFRFFDIVKPFPVSYFDKNFKNSFGVIMDDVCAGFYVVLTLICFMVLSSYFI